METINREELRKEAEEKKQIQTVCGDCAFGKTKEQDNENLSDYCDADRLSSLLNNGASIVNVETEQKNKNYKAVVGRICNMFRNDEWKRIFTVEKEIKEEELVEFAREECKIRCNLIIYVCDKDDENENKEESEFRKKSKDRIRSIAKSMKAAENSELPPRHITIVNNTKISPYNFINWLRIECEQLDIKVKWNMEYITNASTVKIKDEFDAQGQCIDIAAKSKVSKCHYLCVFFEGEEIPKNYLSSIDSLINDKSERILAIVPESKSVGGLFIQKMAYSQFEGYKGGDFMEKITKVAKEQECQDLIKKMSDII